MKCELCKQFDGFVIFFMSTSAMLHVCGFGLLVVLFFHGLQLEAVVVCDRSFALCLSDIAGHMFFIRTVIPTPIEFVDSLVEILSAAHALGHQTSQVASEPSGAAASLCNIVGSCAVACPQALIDPETEEFSLSQSTRAAHHAKILKLLVLSNYQCRKMAM